MPEMNRDMEMEKDVYDVCRKWLSKDRTGIHVSDLISPRQAFLKKMHGNRVSDGQVGKFVAGIAHHGILESMVVKYGDTSEKKVNFEGIFGSIDATRNGFPVEIKTSRAWKSTMISDDYIKQLKMYCVLLNKTKGYIMIFFLSTKEDATDENGDTKTVYGPKIVCHEIVFTEDEIKIEKENMLNNKEVLAYALNNKDGTQLPKCAKWKCADCGYKVECKEIDAPRVIPVEGSTLTFIGK
jgi:CRISPR/Cas system-associated exonuclease Cas4 (RecB family)